MSSNDYSQKIPNNVDLNGDRTLPRALESWQPNFIKWWDDVGPEGSTNHQVYLRTAVTPPVVIGSHSELALKKIRKLFA